jgi:7-carboxy-7-deazaguanine synthase
MSISPKLSNSTPNGEWAAQHDRLRLQPSVLRQLMERYEYQLKFVIENPTDLNEVRALIESLAADPRRVVLMPEGTDRDTLRERGIWLAEIAKAEGYRFTPRLHVELWGNQRGV